MGYIRNGRLTVGVTGFEKSVALETVQAAGLADKLDVYGFFPGGDHIPFKEAGGTVDTINPEILHTVAWYVTAQAWRLASLP